MIKFALMMVLVSSSAFAVEIRLDAACKLKCLVGHTEIDADQGGIMSRPNYAVTYLDLTNLTRAQIDQRLESASNDCKQAFTPVASIDQVDCLYLKH